MLLAKGIMGKNRLNKASLTVETVIVLPIFMFCLMFFLFFFNLLMTMNHLQQGLTNVGYDIAKQVYLYQKGLENIDEEEFNTTVKNIGQQLVGITYISSLLQNEIDKQYINNSMVVNGSKGLNLLSSTILDENDDIDIILKYNVKIPLSIFNLSKISLIQKVKVRGWTGFYICKEAKEEENLEGDEIVYITRTGTVFHRDKDCTHIKLSVKSIASISNNLRNKSGLIYKKCDLCGDTTNADNLFYVTDYGTKYHNSRTCSGIKRDVFEINIKDVAGRRACLKCGKVEGSD